MLRCNIKIFDRFWRYGTLYLGKACPVKYAYIIIVVFANIYYYSDVLNSYDQERHNINKVNLFL